MDKLHCETLYTELMDVINNHPDYTFGEVLSAIVHVVTNIGVRVSKDIEDGRDTIKDICDNISSLYEQTIKEQEKSGEDIFSSIEKGKHETS